MTHSDRGRLRSIADQTDEMRGGEGSILSRQGRDHGELYRLMLDYEAETDPDRRGRIVDVLAERALRHAFAEETVLFPAYRRHLPAEADDLAAHLEGEHRQATVLLAELPGADPRDPAYDATVRRAFTLVSDDARTEEDVLLPRLQQVVDGPELRALGAAWEAARAAAPVPSHPRGGRWLPSEAVPAGGPSGGDLPDAAGARGSLPRSAVLGMLAGVAGVAALTLAEKAEQAVTGRAAAARTGRALGGLTGSSPGRLALVQAVHWSQGSLLGAVRGLLAYAGPRGVPGSLAFAAVRLAADRALGTGTAGGPPPGGSPGRERAAGVRSALVYAVATGLVADRLVRPRAVR